MTGKNLLRALIGLIIAVSLLAVMFSYQVKHYELGVVETLGTISAEPIAPGLRFRWPWPVQKVTKYDCRIQNFESAFAEQTTLDNQSILLGLHVCWRVSDPLVYHRRVAGDLAKGESLIRSKIRSAQNTVVGSTRMEQFASTEDGVVNLSGIEQAVTDQVYQNVLDELGIEILRIGINRTSLPEQVTEVVMDNERKKRTRQAQEAISRGDAAAAGIRSEADAIAKQVLSFAGERAAQIRSRGQAAAAKYYSRYGDDQQFAMFLRRLEYLKETMKVNTMFVLDGTQYDLSHGWFRNSPTAENLGNE